MKTKNLLIAWGLCLSFAALAQNRYHVNQATGNDSRDGLTWMRSFATLQMAIEQVKAGDEIWVAAGTYLPTLKTHDVDSEGNPTSDRLKTFIIPSGVKVYGGFPAQTDISTNMNNRDWERHQTILSGDLNKDDGEDFTNMGENVYRVVTLLNADESTVIDGFTITGGNTDYQVWLRQVAASGIYAIAGGTGSNSSPTLRNLLIEGNVSTGGGAGFSSYSMDGNSCPVISNTIIRRNKSGEYGGGFASEGRIKSSPILENVIISGNQAYKGGGMYCNSEATETSPVLTNVLVSGNASKSDAGGIYLSSYAGNVKPVLTNVTISGNKAGNVVGGLLCYAYTGISLPEIRNTVIWGNKAKEMRYFYDFYNEDNTASLSKIQSCFIGDLLPVPHQPFTLFVSPVDAEFAPTVEGDYRPAKGSPLINQGNNSFVTVKVDLAGKPRIFNQTVDIGAYEYQETASIIQETASEKNIWADGGNLFVKIDQPAIVRIYSIDGVLVRQLSMSEGLTTISLPQGFYIVSLNNKTGVKVFISK
jgi:hypothetical protein